MLSKGCLKLSIGLIYWYEYLCTRAATAIPRTEVEHNDIDLT